MSLLDPTEPAEADEPDRLGLTAGTTPFITTLAARRPGHAAMTHLIGQLAARDPDERPEATVPADLTSWYVGVIGEQVVGQELALLPETWRVFHAIPAGSAGADIDHLVIGPGGVFVLNTKHHAGKTIRVGTHVVWIDGFQQSGYQRELIRRCSQVRAVFASALPAATLVLPMLVFVAPRSVTLSGEQPVASVQSSGLVRYLLSLPPVLDGLTIGALADLAARPSTWRAPESALAEPDPTPAFLALRIDQVAPRAGRPRAGRSTVPLARRSTPRRAPMRLVSLLVALGVSLLVLPAIFAAIATLLGVAVRMLVGS